MQIFSILNMECKYCLTQEHSITVSLAVSKYGKESLLGKKNKGTRADVGQVD